jgi:hypothetical protein
MNEKPINPLRVRLLSNTFFMRRDVGHEHITALLRSRRRASTCPRFASAQSQQR